MVISNGRWFFVARWKQIEGMNLRYSVAECIFRVHASFRDGGTHEGRDEAPRFQQKSTKNFDYYFFFLFFSFLSLSSRRSSRPAIEKSREIGNVSDPVYGLSLQRFAIECRLYCMYIVLLYVYYLYMYIYISILNLFERYLLLKYLWRLYTIYFFFPFFFFKYMYIYMYLYLSSSLADITIVSSFTRNSHRPFLLLFFLLASFFFFFKFSSRF